MVYYLCHVGLHCGVLCWDWSFHMPDSYVTGSGRMSYHNQTLFLSGRVGSGHETNSRIEVLIAIFRTYCTDLGWLMIGAVRLKCYR